MSGVLGAEDLQRKLTTFGLLMKQRIDDRLEPEAQTAQKEAADLVPVRTGRGRETILSPDAIKVDRSPDTGGKRVTFGFITKAMQDAAFYLFWVEFGTKGYNAGDQRSAGVDNKGRRRFRKIKTYVPARPAQPFFRPAIANLMVRLKRERDFKTVVDAVKAASGFADKQNSA
jgi:hypothetical protein